LTPAGGPRIEPINVGGGDLKYRAVFEIVPQIELKGLETLPVERPVADVSAADIDAMIQNLREQKPTFAGVEREARNTDRVTIDFNGTIDGQPFEGGSGENIPIVLGAGRMLADFEAGLVGAKSGEQRTIKLTFPQNYGAPALAGKNAEFAVNVKSVEERHLPELDEEFCKLYGVEQGGIEQLRREVEENMRRELADAIRARLKKQVLDGLAAANPIELPKSMVDAQVRDMQIDTARRMGARDASQIPPPDQFQDAARRRVQLSLLVSEVIKNANIQVNQAQVQARFQDLAQQYPDALQAVEQYRTNPQMRRQMEAAVLEDQVVDWLLERARVTDKESSFKELMNFGA
jgi:trigger factor